MALAQILGEKLTGKDGFVDTSSVSDECDVVGIYFSAHWCPPCRVFTPMLRDKYLEWRKEGKKFQVVFVSFDRDEGSFKGYYDEMPWLAIPFESDLKEELGSKYNVQGIPCLIMLNAKTGKVMNSDGRSCVQNNAYPC